MLLVFRDPRFRLLWTAGAFNELGFIMFYMVHGWLALEITDSPFWVGATMGMSGLGITLFSVFGGVLADRLDRRRLVLASQMVQVTIILGLAFLIFSDQVQLWHVLVVAFLDGVVAAVKVPAKMALTLDVVGRERLLSATAANFAAMTVTAIVGPPVVGNIVRSFDIAWAYVMIGGAILVSASLLLNLRGVFRTARPASSPWQDLRQGIHYVFTTPVVRALILMALVTEGFGWAHDSMLPVMARDVLGIGVSGLGYMIAVAAAGATVSTVIVSNMGDVKEKGRLAVVGVGGFGLFLMLFAASPWFPLSMVLLALAYAMGMAYEATVTTLLQVLVPNEMRGRVLSFQTLTWGVTGLAGFHTGAIAGAVGAPLAIAIGGGIVLLNALRLFRGASRLQEQSAEAGAGD